MREHGPWKIVESREVYRDAWIGVQIDDVVRPDGRAGTHSIIHIKPGACVVPLDAAGNVYLTEEFHYAVGRVTCEGVSGGSDDGETPLQTAQRELREELGISAGQWTDLGVVDPFTSNVVSPTALFLAEKLTFAHTAREGTETMHMRSVPLREALAMVWDGRITHAPTCVALLKASVLRGG